MNKILTVFSTLLITTASLAIQAKSLTIDVYNADAQSFHVNASVIYGDKEAIVVDTGFTKADALRIAAKVLDSGKTLKTIFISQADPDYYFGAETLVKLFPQAKVLTTAKVHAKIKATMAGKVAYWGEKMGENAPITPVLPEILQADELSLEGHTIEIHGTAGALAHRPYLYIPDNKAVVGNVAIFNDLHVWLADTQTSASVNAWLAQLKEIAALSPATVVPGHMKKGVKMDASAISYTATYIEKFIAAKQTAKNGDALIKTMTTQYPTAGLNIALAIGAKVHTGEMKW